MRKKATLLMALILIIALILPGCTEKQKTEPTQPTQASTSINKVAERSDINHYDIDVELDAANKTLKAEQTIKYINSDPVTLKEIYFHVYPNAFRKKETAPFLFDSFDTAYPEGFKPGKLDMKSVAWVDKDSQIKPLSFSFEGEDETIMKVELKTPLKQGDSMALSMSYEVVIPPANERFGWGKDNFNLGNWYPIAAVYDENGWNLDKYYAIGDPFYSDTADYNVKIKAPSEYIIASSGLQSKDNNSGNFREWQFEANSMRDFAFIANRNFEIAEKNVQGTIVKSYYYKTDKKRGKIALEKGAQSIEIFNKMFGNYPYPSYSVVETVFPSGMEYPGIVYISDDSYKPRSSEDWLTTVIVHETAHQWWYGIIGDDEIDEAWLDEGFATYSEKVYNEIAWGKRTADKIFDENVDSRGKEAMTAKIIDGVVVKPLDQFRDWSDYGPTVYTRGAQVLNELRKKVGDETFFKIIQTYYKDFQFKNAKTTDFINVAQKVSGQKLDSFFNSWLYAK